MRFNAHEYVDTWKAIGRYPAIHDDIFTAAQSFMKGSTVLDLCCSTGLLGTRLHKMLGVEVIGVDADTRALDYATRAGIPITLVHMEINATTMKDLVELCESHKIDTVIARRCFPELFGHDRDLGRKFALHLSRCNVQEIFIEGRVATKNSVNALATLKNEVELMAPHFKAVRAHKNVAYLHKVP